MLEGDTEREGSGESEAEAIELSDLHAKLYVSERGWDAHIWTGSANATAAAFGWVPVRRGKITPFKAASFKISSMRPLGNLLD